MLVAGYDAAAAVDERVGQPAILGTLAPIGTAAAQGLAQVALPAVTYTEGTVHEYLERNLHRSADGPYFVERELPGQYHLRESAPFEKLHLLGGAVVGLRAGMQGNGRNVEPGDAHVLHDEGIDPDAVELADEPLGLGQFVVVEQGVESDVDAGIEAVGKVDEPGQVVEAVAGCGPGTEPGCTYVDGIGPVEDGLFPYLCIFGRSQQFYAASVCHRISFRL